jgi:hypothetical protein
MNRAILVIGLLLLCATVQGEPAADTSRGTISAEWSADLHAAVGSIPLGMVVGRGHETLGLPYTSLYFLDNATVVATFVIREGEPTVSSRNNSYANLPLQLRAIFLDAVTGKIASIQTWPTESRVAGIVAAKDGNFVTQRGNVLALYSPNAKELRNLSLPPMQDEQEGDSWQAYSSPTGRNILFVSSSLTALSATPWIEVDTNSLKILRSWNELRTGWVGISDSTIAMTACSFWQYHCDPHVVLKSLATEWKSIASIEKSHFIHPQFVNEDMLFLSGTPWKLLRTDGKVILTDRTPFEGFTAISSAGGQRFVAPFFKLVGSYPAFDIGGHGELKAISIYDAPFHDRSYRLDVKGPKITELAHVALSPDGSKLAILNGELVFLYVLPPAK